MSMTTFEAMVSQSGFPVKFGASGTLAWTGTGHSADVFYQIVEVSLSDRFNVVTATASGAFFAAAAVEQMREIQVGALIYGDATASTQPLLRAADDMPAPLGKVTLTIDDTILLNGDWNYEGASEPQTDGQFVRRTFTLTRRGITTGKPAYMPTTS